MPGPGGGGCATPPCGGSSKVERQPSRIILLRLYHDGVLVSRLCAQPSGRSLVWHLQRDRLPLPRRALVAVVRDDDVAGHAFGSGGSVLGPHKVRISSNAFGSSISHSYMFIYINNLLADGVGFEPTNPCGLAVFKTAA